MQTWGRAARCFCSAAAAFSAAALACVCKCAPPIRNTPDKKYRVKTNNRTVAEMSQLQAQHNIVLPLPPGAAQQQQQAPPPLLKGPQAALAALQFLQSNPPALQLVAVRNRFGLQQLEAVKAVSICFLRKHACNGAHPRTTFTPAFAPVRRHLAERRPPVPLMPVSQSLPRPAAMSPPQ